MSRISYVVLLVALTGILSAQKPYRYPADSLLASNHVNLVKKTGLLPIAAWQRISYNTDLLNCQFAPSCSNYGSQAIRRYGVLRGAVVATERIMRCNGFAWHYHVRMHGEFQAADGRLVDPLIPETGNPSGPSDRSPVTAALLSALVPGAGRIYAGRWLEGLLGFSACAYSAYLAHSSSGRDHPVRSGIFLSVTALLYGGEIYGAYRTAKYYYPPAAKAAIP